MLDHLPKDKQAKQTNKYEITKYKGKNSHENPELKGGEIATVPEHKCWVLSTRPGSTAAWNPSFRSSDLSGLGVP